MHLITRWVRRLTDGHGRAKRQGVEDERALAVARASLAALGLDEYSDLAADVFDEVLRRLTQVRCEMPPMALCVVLVDARALPTPTLHQHLAFLYFVRAHPHPIPAHLIPLN